MNRVTRDRRLATLRDELLDAQLQLHRDPAFALAFIVAGVPAAGRSEVVNELLEWLDPKRVSVHAFHQPDQEDRRKPAMHRYWLTLPARGRITFYFAGWYGEYFAEVQEGPKSRRARSRRSAERIRSLEAMLAADRVRVVKVYLTIDARTQRERLAKLRADKLTRWRVTKEDEWLAKHYKRVARAADRCIEATDCAAARWHVVDGSDEEKRLSTVAQLLRDELRMARAQTRAPQSSARAPTESRSGRSRPLPTRPRQPVADDKYEDELEFLSGRLARVVRRSAFRKHALVLAFEGVDAAGKGGAIRRITHALDARQYRVVPVAAPTPAEALHPYLWRFWRCVPELGAITIYDRSWYGRVLVERVRGLASDPDWKRAYDEIREFELELAEHGIIVAKFWLSIGKKEQLERFKSRDEDPLKRFKVDKEDWENRRYYDAYQAAAIDMIERTHANHARWTVVPADHKKTARLSVLRTICESVERALDG